MVTVARARSFRGAALALRLPRTSVSRKVAELEQQLGAQLLRRTTRHVALTEAGEAFVLEAEAGLAHLAAAEAAVTDADREPRGTLRVTATVPLGQLFLAPLVSEFLVAHPQVRVNLRLTQQPVDLVRERIDVALRAGRLTSPSLVAVVVGRSAHRFVASPGYLEARGVPRTPSELAAHDCLAFAGDGARGASFQVRRARRAGELAIEARFTADDFLALRAAALGGLGIAQLPESLVLEPLRRGALVAVLEDCAPPPVALNLVLAGGRRAPARVRAFVDFLRPRLSRALARGAVA